MLQVGQRRSELRKVDAAKRQAVDCENIVVDRHIYSVNGAARARGNGAHAQHLSRVQHRPIRHKVPNFALHSAQTADEAAARNGDDRPAAPIRNLR